MGRLSDVEIFVAVVDEGGFTAAAEALSLSKSYVSKRVRALEDHVGSPLLTRNTRHVAPTPLGEMFHERARVALEILDDAELLAAREADVPRGRLKISLPLSFGLAYLAEPLARFAAQHPDLTVDASYTDRKVDLVDEGYDLAIRIGNLADSELLARRIASSSPLILASPGYLETHGMPAKVEDLQDHELLAYTLMPEPHKWQVPTGNGTIGVKVSGRMIADNGEALMHAALAGLGIGVFPDWLARPHVESGELVRVLPELPVPTMGVWAVYPSHRHLSAKVSQVIEAFAEALEPPPWGRCPTE